MKRRKKEENKYTESEKNIDNVIKESRKRQDKNHNIHNFIKLSYIYIATLHERSGTFPSSKKIQFEKNRSVDNETKTKKFTSDQRRVAFSFGVTEIVYGSLRI